MRTEHLILGGSAAGVAAAAAIAAKAPKDGVTLLCKDQFFYSRCVLHLVATGVKSHAQAGFATAANLAGRGVSLRLGATALEVDASARRVLLENGERLAYDNLLVATGSSAWLPPIPGLKGQGTYCLRDIGDADAISAALGSVKEICVIGAGLIGSELAMALIEAGKSVSLVETAPYPLPLQLEPVTGALCAESFVSHGIDLRCAECVEAVERNADGLPQAVRLKSGGVIPADMVVCCTGVKANVQMFAGTGVKQGRGVTIDHGCRSSLPGIYAAGDVTEADDALLNIVMPSAIWPTAIRQGRVAGANMAGGEESLTRNTGMKTAFSLFGVNVVSVGQLKEGPGISRSVFAGKSSKGVESRKILFLAGSVLKGAILWGDITNAGLYTEAIVNGRDIADDMSFLDTLDAGRRGREKLASI